jgi:hypothetical protein
MPIAQLEISKIYLFAAQGAARAVYTAGLRPTGESEADTVAPCKHHHFQTHRIQLLVFFKSSAVAGPSAGRARHTWGEEENHAGSASAPQSPFPFC